MLRAGPLWAGDLPMRTSTDFKGTKREKVLITVNRGGGRGRGQGINGRNLIFCILISSKHPTFDRPEFCWNIIGEFSQRM